MNHHLRVAVWMVAVQALAGHSLVAQTPTSVVDHDTPLEHLSSDFVMADGPCWDWMVPSSFPMSKGNRF